MSSRRAVLVLVALAAVAGLASWLRPRPERRPPADQPGPMAAPAAVLPPKLLALCEGLEAYRDGAYLSALLAAVPGLTPEQRGELAGRAAPHVLSHPGDSPYLPLLVGLRAEALPLMERAMREPAQRETAFALWAQMTTVNGYRAWASPAPAPDRAVLARALVERLDQPEDRDGAEVRSLALGLAVRLFDARLLPELKQLREREPNLNTRWTAHRLVAALEGRKVKGPRSSGIVPPPEAPQGSGP